MTTTIALDGEAAARASEILRLESIERVGSITPDRFRGEFLAPRRPVVLTAFAAGWPALGKWTPDWLAAHHGAEQVEVYDASFADPGRSYMSNVRTMRFDEYLDCVLNRDMDLRMFLYNIASRIPALRADVPVPDLANGFSERFVFTFFGCRGSVTPAHYDIDLSHVFHTAIRGTKRITLFAPTESHRLHRHPFTVRSYVDVDAPDVERFPRLAGARGFQVTLEPGETLFIPAGFWHHVVYVEGGYAVSLRLANERPGARLAGLANLALISPVDRLLNRVLGARWFAIKARLAGERQAARSGG